MPLPAQSWTVSCRACNLVIGAIEGGRFIHDPACPHPLAIGSGLLRCCHCGGRLSGEAQPVVDVDLGLSLTDDEADDAPLPSILPFVPRHVAEETRQRL